MFKYSLLIGLIAVTFAIKTFLKLRKQPRLPKNIAEIGGIIQKGARTYLLRQLRTISMVVPFLFVLLLIIFDWQVASVAVLGVFTSLLGTFIGMTASTYANSRVANSASESTDKSFRLAVLGGSITGFCVTGLSLIVLSVLYLIFKDYQVLVGFGFGASLAALFAQIGGGIFTKSADVGADLVGKVELKLPEDDKRNPAVIADLVGDNVGDCAGRGSDLFETFSDDIITGTLIASAFLFRYGPLVVFYPILLQCCGILSSMIALYFTRKWGKKMLPTQSFNLGLAVGAALSLISSYILTKLILPDLSIWLGVVLGVVVTLVSAITTRFFAGTEGKPVRRMADASKRGAAINLIIGIGFALQSTIPSIIMIVLAVIVTYAVTGGSLLAVVGINIGTDLLIAYIMTADTFGPITDNAAGIAEMAKSDKETVKSLSSLDSVGNTMKAITKAYSMASGTVTAFVIFSTFFNLTGIKNLDVTNPYTIAFLLVGVALPFLISSLVIGSTAKGAYLMVDEVRRQFREIKGLLKGEAKPDYNKCIDITTKNALNEMLWPGIISIVVPLILGYIFKAQIFGALLIGSVVSAALLGPFFNNLGTALDNAKKIIEDNEELKGTPQYDAAVIGDTVGDPLKDVAGPSLLIFMKLIGMTALLAIPLLR